MIIDIRDEDNESESQFVDQLLINHAETVGDPSQRRNYTERSNYVTMDLTVTVLCEQNFQGQHCTECTPGFTGTYCDTNIDDCIGVTCSGHGACIDGIAGYACNCSRGYEGEACEGNINDCLGVNCSGNGQCVDGFNTYHCSCDPGFSGEFCQTNVDDCDGVMCSGNGECLDGINNFTCECAPDYSGPQCTDFTLKGTIVATIANIIKLLSGYRGFVGGISGGLIGLLFIFTVGTVTAIKWKLMSHKSQLQEGCKSAGICIGIFIKIINLIPSFSFLENSEICIILNRDW